MFRYVTAILLLTAFAAQTFQQAAIVLSYYTNSTSFVKSCENKAKPMMHCNGKCQMMKKLQEEEKKDGQAPERKLENKVEVVSSNSFFANLTTERHAIQTNFLSHYCCLVPQGKTSEIFHPPTV